MNDLLRQMLSDTSISTEERTVIGKLYHIVKDHLVEEGVDPILNIQELCDELDVNYLDLPKDGVLLYALWVAFLLPYKEKVTLEELKYPTLESFLEAYPGWFENETPDELINLWHTANWMTFLFSIITARKNKGLVMQIIPKLVEGWEAKYVTGSGQTRRTANRVHIFESEGNTKANHRGKFKPKGRVKNSERSAVRSGSQPEYHKRGRKRKPGRKPGPKKVKIEVLVPSEDEEDDEDFSEPPSPYPYVEEHHIDGGITDGEEEHPEENVNPEVKLAYASLRKTTLRRDESQWKIDLIRTNSILSVNLEPIDLKRTSSFPSPNNPSDGLQSPKYMNSPLSFYYPAYSNVLTQPTQQQLQPQLQPYYNTFDSNVPNYSTYPNQIPISAADYLTTYQM